ncbi:MAG: COX15/CtaA family protein [Acetobacteraceae bacterium]|nr:COX15/CtaA family protein [Acetobacteraceae bacterium]
MPFDPTHPPQTGPAGRGPHGTVSGQPRALAAWLFLVAFLVWVMVALGGATRLTGSGLSIMEWAPLSGTLPPMSEAEWQRLYDLYRTIPQYALVNQGFGMEGFRQIFWLEYVHRLWGRLLGLAFGLPLAWFWLKGAVPASLRGRLVLLLALGGLQGAVGWFMVASGFDAGRTSVNPYRLVIHLGLAFLIFGLLVWTALDLVAPEPLSVPAGARAWVRRAFVLAAAAMLAGGFVAGIRAGLDYNSFPLMEGRLVPSAYLDHHPWWRAFFEHIATVQFNHRLLATLALLGSIIAAAVSWPAVALRVPLLLLVLAVVAQYALGIATLLAVVPVGLGTAHQSLAMGVLAAFLFAMHRTGTPRPALAHAAAGPVAAAR